MKSLPAGDDLLELVCRNDVIQRDNSTGAHRASPLLSHPCEILGTSSSYRKLADQRQEVVVHNSQPLLLQLPEFQLHNKEVGKALR
jgi:hypothetical protein